MMLLTFWVVLAVVAASVSGYQFGSFKFGSAPGFKGPGTTKKDPALDRAKIGTLDVSAVGVGTIAWFSDKDKDSKVLDGVVRDALSQGCDFFDTAERYGSGGLEALGQGWGTGERFLSKYGDLGIKVGTKFTPTPSRRTAQSVVDAAQRSCERLGVTSLDLYQIHMPDIVQPLKIFGLGETKDTVYWDGLAECYKRGLVKNVGVSNYGPSLLLRASDHLSKRGVPLASNQINYSLLHRLSGAQETVDIGNAMGLTTLAYFPLAMGLLSGKHSVGSEAALQSSGKSALELRELRSYATAPLLKVMREIAQTRGKSVAQVALNWIICKGAIPIPGVRNGAQLEDNLGSRGWRLSSREVGALESAADLCQTFDGAGFKRSSGKFVGYGVEKWSLD
ncbi:NADP-dependent oxidoreductase domain-containing protein [Ochromonadaceae sp. CCMP2298]|nr:NADP-dependent oxidoreductase domain-containing protein [Ochromonadaceae sp. CCMP2298]|mmetsp:Transcript_11278/g.25081  ORF Transcript_11278/g.25081 Transcript_11278/m.25081 type:complete len:392 (+) Transcript_11278:134-1309(+)|eukprot:CAMPEP_0173251688 /NCGR_PEP_ID=MMETSP1142-20121109/20289_1 /TAXON_ID=483371 /ORGANISM="non described non described, Strain CCMP2298" /LENGTH=391 /DNA_ID=CAMNT_0014184605 /DNA_START=65 /DNA_END=1240 /DNA_ORIENTATION=+